MLSLAKHRFVWKNKKKLKEKLTLWILTWSFSKIKHARKVFFSEHNSYTDQNSTQSMNSALTKITCLTQRCFSVQALFEKKKPHPPPPKQKKKTETKQRSEFCHTFFAKWNMSEIYSSQSIIPIRIKNSTQSINSTDQKMLLWPNKGLVWKNKKKRNKNKRNKNQAFEFWHDVFSKWNMPEKYSSQSITPIQIKNSTQSINSVLTKNTCLTPKMLLCSSSSFVWKKTRKPPPQTKTKKTETKQRSEFCHAFFAKKFMSEIYSSQSMIPIQIKNST